MHNIYLFIVKVGVSCTYTNNHKNNLEVFAKNIVVDRLFLLCVIFFVWSDLLKMLILDTTWQCILWIMSNSWILKYIIALKDLLWWFNSLHLIKVYYSDIWCLIHFSTCCVASGFWEIAQHQLVFCYATFLWWPFWLIYFLPTLSRLFGYNDGFTWVTGFTV